MTSKPSKVKSSPWLWVTASLLYCGFLASIAKPAQDAGTDKRVKDLIAEYKSTANIDRKKTLIQSIVLLEVDDDGRRHISHLLEQCREELPVATWARSLLFFAKRGGPITSIQGEMLFALQEADLETKCDIIEALRYSSKLEEPTVHALKQIALSSNEPDSTYAVVTLLASKSELEAAKQKLIAQLRSDQERTVVRAATLYGAAGVQDKEIYNELSQLIHADNYSVRLAAAYAIAMTHHESEETIGVLRESLKREDWFIALRLQYPSNPGMSHKILAIGALRELRGKASAATDELMDLVKLASKEVDPNSLKFQVGVAALLAIPSIAGENRVLADELEEVTKHSDLMQGYSIRVRNILRAGR